MPNNDQGPKYTVDIEGTLKPWDKPTITTEELAELGGWAVSQGVIEIDKDNNERTLQLGEIIELKPGHGFSKKVRWKRGDRVAERIEAEVALLRRYYPDLEYVDAGHWVRIPAYPTGAGWNRATTDVAVQIPAGYPGAAPYGIYVPIGLLCNGAAPNNYTAPASNTPPFAGSWGVLSWAPADGWRPTADLITGPNMLNFVRGFSGRFREGV